MRQVDRSRMPAPATLTTAKTGGLAELDCARTYFSGPPPRSSFKFSAYKAADVRHTLEALFRGKCAYCEARYDVTGPIEIEHFRPKGPAAGGEHSGYWWLAADWTNLLPSCLDCNRRRWQLTPVGFASLSALLAGSADTSLLQSVKTGKESCFPVAGVRTVQEPPSGSAESAREAEDALLLDPCRDDPTGHLVFYIDRQSPLGLVYPRAGAQNPPVLPAPTGDTRIVEERAQAAGVSVRGAVSIQVYGLNRLSLVQERTRTLRQLEFLAITILDLSRSADDLELLELTGDGPAIRDDAVVQLRSTVQRLLAQIRSMAEPDAPFSTMVAAWMRAFIADVV